MLKETSYQNGVMATARGRGSLLGHPAHWSVQQRPAHLRYRRCVHGMSAGAWGVPCKSCVPHICVSSTHSVCGSWVHIDLCSFKYKRRLHHLLPEVVYDLFFSPFFLRAFVQNRVLYSDTYIPYVLVQGHHHVVTVAMVHLFHPFYSNHGTWLHSNISNRRVPCLPYRKCLISCFSGFNQIQVNAPMALQTRSDHPF
jgi:hypothetical protein